VSCEHNFSIIIGKQKNWFVEIVTHLACSKCGKTIDTGQRLFEPETAKERAIREEMP
jgi:hypothetical protein